MAYPTKIATCCYCGARAALTLNQGRHELACASCGAPLHALKSLPKSRAKSKKRKSVSHRPKVREFPREAPVEEYRARKPRKVKRRKSLFARVAEEAFDLVEDIFD